MSSPRPRYPEDGRPKGTYKRFAFWQTPLGFMLRYEVPIIYHVLRMLAPRQVIFEPPYQVVKAVCDASPDPSLLKPKFRRYLEHYRSHGLYCRRAKRLTPARRAYYEALRRRKIAAYIAQHAGELTDLKTKAREQGLRPQPLLDLVQQIYKKHK